MKIAIIGSHGVGKTLINELQSLYPKMKIAQVAFFELKTRCEKSYDHKSLNSKYFGSNTIEESKMNLNY